LAGGAGERSASAPGRERKVATLLFADLVGFTGLGESNDPEVVGALVARAFGRLAAEVARYEGTLEKFAGDALLAVFGVPTVHEDDPERAVRAALEMQAAMAELAPALEAEGRRALQLRIGIEGGEVLVDLARAAEQRDLFVTGDAVNTAARLQQAAAPATIVVGPTVYAATRDVVDYEELPTTQLKGKTLPVAAWRAVAVKARRGGRRPPLGLESPLVGREEELALLKETVRRTVADARPHLVTVLGAAGVGKSRLTWELEKYLDGLPETFHWRKGRCLAYAQVSYSALADAAKADAEIRDDDAPATAAARLARRLADLGGGEPEQVALEALLAIRPAAGVGREDLFEGWRRWLELVARRAPLVLVLEDLHWADDGLLDVVEHVARWADGRILILVLARHELLERRPSWGGGLPNAATIVLEPLAPAESGALVDGLVGSALPAALRDRVVALADGNPLFAEELVRMFVDRGVLRFTDGRWELAAPVEELEVPSTVQAVLAARLDALPPSEKRLAQNASVVGRIFWDAVVAHLSRQGVPATGDLLRRLRVKELVVPREPSSLAGAAEFGFRHVLIRDVAYDSLPKRDRAALHLDVARWAETELADRLDEIIELVASHYVAALRFEEEFASEGDARLRQLREATYRYARRAGARAAALHQVTNATRWLTIAVDEARRLALPPSERAGLAEEFFEGTHGGAELASGTAILAEAVGLLENLDDRDDATEQLLGRLRAAVAFWQFNDDVDAARAVLGTGIAALEGGPPTRARALLLARLGWTYWRAGPTEDALPLLRRAIDEARASDAPDVERLALHELGVALAQLGRPEEAVPLVEQSYVLAKAANDRLLLTRCYNNLPSVMLGAGRPWEEVRPMMQEGLDLLRRSGDRANVGWLAQSFGDILFDRGELEASRPYFEEAIEASLSVGDRPKGLVQQLSLRYADYFGGDGSTAAEIDRIYDELDRYHGEPQAEIYAPSWRAFRTWPTDPRAAIAILRPVVERSHVPWTVEYGGRWLARMAWRIGDAEALRLGAAKAMRASSTGGAVVRLQARWMQALVGPPEEAAPTLREVAADLAGIGERWLAGDCQADAALAAARHGDDDGADLELARERYAAAGVIPVLGELPETAWADRSGRASAAGGGASGAENRTGRAGRPTSMGAR
jgi:class 3 adenylate cyclase/tetratricopeptide (TPR) repeat protein